MRILVVDDDPAVRDAVRRALGFDGYDVATATDGVEALDVLAAEQVDAGVLDVLMPRMDGLDVCRRLRSAGDTTPILLLTARSPVEERVDGLDAGADDYLVKPFALQELLARVRALLRRGGATATRVLRFADLSLDPETREVLRGERSIELSRTEFRLLEVLIRNPRRVLTRELLLDRVCGYDFETSSKQLEVYDGYLREKKEAGGDDRLI